MITEPHDQSVINQFLEDVGEAARNLIPLFVNETRARVNRMEQLTNASDWRSLGDEAHALKSSSGTYGLTALALIAAELERACRDGRHADAKLQMGLIGEKTESMLNTYVSLVEKKLGA